MRRSSYGIMIKVDNIEGRYALLNGYTQAFDIVDANIYNYLRANGQGAQISDEMKEKLVLRGHLTSLSREEETELVKRLLDKTYSEVRLKNFSFHFIISYDCNLRCIYCYEAPVLNGATCLSKKRITKEQVDKAFDIIVEKDKNRKGDKKLALYGGEPLLADNYEMVTYIVDRGKELGYRFSVTSNGYDVDKFLNYIENNKIFSFQITLDGVEDVHNLRKPHFQNNDSFEKITNNIDSLLKLGIPVSVRINTDTYTMQRIEELIDFFRERGWYEYKGFKAYCALIRKDVPVNRDFSRSSEEIFTQSNFYRIFSDKCLRERSKGKVNCQDYRVYNILTNLLLGKPVYRKGCFCGAQSGCIIFDPMGDVYSCWDVVGQKEQRVGRYIPDFKLDGELSKKWFGLKVSESKCAKCKYVFFCGGGCPASSLRVKGKVQTGDCNDYPRLFNYELQLIYDKQIKSSLNEGL